MSIPADAAAPRPARAPARWSVPRLLRDPLLHFLLIGAALFAIDHALAAREDDPRAIVVGREVADEARQVFRASRGREPNEAELRALQATWLDNEVLYREGLALQMDKGDSAIRERIIFKALSMVNANLAQPPLDEGEVRRWFEANRFRYDEPARFDYQEAVHGGDATEANVRAFVQALNRGAAPDGEAGLRVFRARPLETVVQTYGREFADALADAPPGEWRAVPSRESWRAVRVERVGAAQPADFERLKGVVLHDWIDAKMAEQRTAAVRTLAQKYRIRYEEPSK